MINREYTGKNEKQALKKAEEDLGVSREKMEVEVLSRGKSGLLGFGSSEEAKIRVRVPEDQEAKAPLTESDKDAYADVSMNFVKGLFERMGIDAAVKIACIEEGKLFLDLDSDRSALIIGRRGKTLEAVQMLTNIAASRQSGVSMKTVIDIENYREKRETILTNLALKKAEEARKTRKPCSLEPMNPFERRLIHLALQDVIDVETRSDGEGMYRKVKIIPKK